jgi:hypothetical protein
VCAIESVIQSSDVAEPSILCPLDLQRIFYITKQTDATRKQNAPCQFQGCTCPFLHRALPCLERCPPGSRISYERFTKWNRSAVCGSYGNQLRAWQWWWWLPLHFSSVPWRSAGWATSCATFLSKSRLLSPYSQNVKQRSCYWLSWTRRNIYKKFLLFLLPLPKSCLCFIPYSVLKVNWDSSVSKLLVTGFDLRQESYFTLPRRLLLPYNQFWSLANSTVEIFWIL